MTRFLLTVLIISSLGACTLEDPATGVDISQIITLEADQYELRADGLARATLTATLGPLADANQTIIFTTESGRFAGADSETPQTLSITTSGKTAQATLIAGTDVAEEVVVSARVSNFLVPRIFTFNRAYAQDLTVVADKQTITADRIDFATVTIQLFRNEGTPSGNARIDLEVTPQDTASAEVLPFVFTNGDVATVNVKSGNGKPGQVSLKCTTAASNGAVLERSLDLIFE